MRNLIYPYFILTVLLLSCREKDPSLPAGQEFEAYKEGGDATKWQPGDRIMVFQDSDVYSDFVYSGDDPSDKALFSGNLNAYSDKARHFAVFPSSSARGFEKGVVSVLINDNYDIPSGTDVTELSCPAVSTASGHVFRFMNILGGIRFTLTEEGIRKITVAGNGDEDVAGEASFSFDAEGYPSITGIRSGKKTVSLRRSGGASFETGREYRLPVLPCEFKDGLTVSFEMTGSTAVKEWHHPVAIERNSFVSIYSIDQGIEFKQTGAVEDLSAGGNANCYLVSKKGNYKFNAAVKGPGAEPLEGAYSTETLWESFGTGAATQKGDIISEVRYSEGFISFYATGADGNAVIAIKDKDGRNLWSWHIWAVGGYDPVKSAQKLNVSSALMMDRNLGATSVSMGTPSSLGLLYQWGRKDPFPGASQCSYATSRGQRTAPTSAAWPPPVQSDEIHGTEIFAAENPMTFILGNELNMDWVYTGSYKTDNTRWRKSGSPEKMRNDPCPPGWRIPDLYSNAGTFWTAALGDNEPRPSGLWRNESPGMDFGSANGLDEDMHLGENAHIWYPAAGYMDGTDGSLCEVGESGRYYSSWCDSRYARFLYFNSYGYVYPQYMAYRSYGLSIRCIAEQNI